MLRVWPTSRAPKMRDPVPCRSQPAAAPSRRPRPGRASRRRVGGNVTRRDGNRKCSCGPPVRREIFGSPAMHESFHPCAFIPVRATLHRAPSTRCDAIDTATRGGSPARVATGRTFRYLATNGKPRQNRGQRHADCPHPRAGRRGEGRLVVMVSKTTWNSCKSRLRACLLLRLLRTLGLAGARGLACRGGLRLGGLACTLLGRLLGGFLRSFLGSHGSSQLLISWQWLPSERMQKRLAQKIAVRGVPQVGHLTPCTLVGKKPEYMQRDRDGDLPNLLGFGTVLDVWLYVLGSRHVSVLRHVVGRKASPTQTWCQSIFCGK